MFSSVVAGIRSALTYVLVSIYVILVGPPAMAIGGLLRWKYGMYLLGHGGVGLALGLSGIRYKVAGGENVPDRSVVFCSNHQSNVDGPVLFQALHSKLHFLYKTELHSIPVLGWVFDVGGFVAVDRRSRERAIASVARAADSVRAGNSFLIFPEGTRSRHGELLPFKKGGLIMAIQAQAPVVPVAVLGGRDSMRKGSALVYPVRVSVRIGQPIPTAGLSVDERDELLTRVRTEVQNLLDQGPLWN